MPWRVLRFLLFYFPIWMQAQPTVGLISFENNSYEGYTLFSPINSTTSYLIDNCGYLIHTWESAYIPGKAAYLLDNGNLLRSGVVPGVPLFSSGGYGGIVQILDVNSNILWEFHYASATVIQHHDIKPMPNGNVLILAWEVKSEAESLAAGRNPLLVGQDGIYAEHLVEIQPIGQDSGLIVWEWHIWDHLVQDYDQTKLNYGVIADHPELFNFNYHPSNNGADWLHFNSLDYNAALDQILLSSRFNDEIYIIDHSTTSSESAGHTGGDRARGGDILYRWGNAEAYDRGFPEERKLFRQHDAHWIPQGYPDEGKIMIFNNGTGRPIPFTSIDLIEPLKDNDGNYVLNGDAAYGPQNPEYVYIAPDSISFRTEYMGGARRQPNGNTLITDTPDGLFFEVDPSGNIVWEYISPIAGAGIVTQGDPVPVGPSLGNEVFWCERLTPSHPGLQFLDLTPGDPLELNPIDYECPVITSVSQVDDIGLRIYPNPGNEYVIVEVTEGVIGLVQFFDIMGNELYSGDYKKAQQIEIDVSGLASGVYILRIMNKTRRFLVHH